MNAITAVVLSDKPYERQFDGLNVLVHQSAIADAKQLRDARFAAVRQVETPFFFFLDDDDDLPTGYMGVLELCVWAGADVAYTDELVRDDAGVDTPRIGRAYSQAAHLRDPLLIHHLALCRTQAAREAIERLPEGHLAPELLLYWELAKGGAAHIPAYGYIWNRRRSGMSYRPCTHLSWMKALLWCKEHP